MERKQWNLPLKPRDIKNRPALVVSLDIRNKLANDIIVVPLSTNLRPSPTHVLLNKGEGGLSKPSMAKCEQVTTIDKALLIKELINLIKTCVQQYGWRPIDLSNQTAKLGGKHLLPASVVSANLVTIVKPIQSLSSA